MPPNIRFGDPESLYRHLLKFAAKSPTDVTYAGDTYTIHHTQFASYNVQHVFETIVDETTSDPRGDGDFDTEVETAIEQTDVCIGRDLRYHYQRREHIKPRDMGSAAVDYSIYNIDRENNESHRGCVSPRAGTREEAIAEVFTLYLADQAAALHRLHHARQQDADDRNYPDPDVNTSEAACVLREIALNDHGPSTLSQPDPSLHTVQKIHDIYEDIGMQQDVRDVYSIFIDPSQPDYYAPHDADSRRTMKSLGSLMRGSSNPAEKWASNAEPPLETLDSYRERQRSQEQAQEQLDDAESPSSSET